MGEQLHIIRRPEHLAIGGTDAEIRRTCSNGEWTRIHRGAYVSRAQLSDLAVHERHRVRVRAVANAAHVGSIVSHTSAAVIHGFELWNTPLDRVHLSRNRRGGSRQSPDRHVHSAQFADDEVTTVDGLAVTTPGRTVVDLARSLPFEQALVAGNSALRRTPVGIDEIKGTLSRVPRHPLHRHAFHAVSSMDARIESVGESRSLALFVRERLPIPQPQVQIGNARVDFLWREHRTIGEFDGRVKYGRLVPAGRSAEDVLWEEKLREDRLREAGWQVARWTWADLSTPSLVARRITAAFERGRGA
ncbi:hypothetical protein [Rhodococcus sp. IEGM 1379]|uniref:hypothetical protein n=1 Tax=Rhodococcus sp. IEGM 1379 TaxID=3047086 RepID=UPI0024B708CC|nr:hypothetical protein [Rhodococcus sp. IEGM 1379]MDI9916192.1 hypothetical protein [Rhodococcus sp. IEGM 1379]